jgi:DNA-binding NarL/FixJ family response regulator
MANQETFKALVVNAITGKETLRDLTEEELADNAIRAIIEQEKQAELEAKATARASALAKLAELGLTADEIAAL